MTKVNFLRYRVVPFTTPNNAPDGVQHFTLIEETFRDGQLHHDSRRQITAATFGSLVNAVLGAIPDDASFFRTELRVREIQLGADAARELTAKHLLSLTQEVERLRHALGMAEHRIRQLESGED